MPGLGQRPFLRARQHAGDVLRLRPPRPRVGAEIDQRPFGAAGGHHRLHDLHIETRPDLLEAIERRDVGEREIPEHAVDARRGGRATTVSQPSRMIASRWRIKPSEAERLASAGSAAPSLRRPCWRHRRSRAASPSAQIRSTLLTTLLPLSCAITALRCWMSETSRSKRQLAKIRPGRVEDDVVDIGARLADGGRDRAERAGFVERRDQDLRRIERLLGVVEVPAHVEPLLRLVVVFDQRGRMDGIDRDALPRRANADDALARHRAALGREAHGDVPIDAAQRQRSSRLVLARHPEHQVRRLGEAEPAALVAARSPAPLCAPPGNRDRSRARRRRNRSRRGRRR